MPVRVAPGERPASIVPSPCTDPDPDRWVEKGRLPGILVDGVPSHERIARSYRNGCYQHLLSLGIAGHVICNHIDREIVLVDPWPTYHSYWTRVNWLQWIYPGRARRPLRDQDSDGKTRIASLASFLRHAVQMGYTLTGILVSHMHFDHADDIALLLELLAGDTVAQMSLGDTYRGTYVDHADRSFTLYGPPVPTENLPKICCDYDTLFYLLTYGLYMDYRYITIDGDAPVSRIGRDTTRFWSGNGDLQEALNERIAGERDPYVTQNTDAWRRVKDRYTFDPPSGLTGLVNTDAWLEISAGGQRLHYDDAFNSHLDPSQRCNAGEACTEFDLGSFRISPYVWDHLNTGMRRRRREVQDEQGAGRLQRMSAFMIKHNNAEEAKRTFIVGSSGEMSTEWTDAVTPITAPIETEVLIHAITRPRPSVLNFTDQIDAYMGTMVRNITVREALILCHFEEFVTSVADTADYMECFDEAVEYNLNVLREKAVEAAAEDFECLLNNNRIHVLARHGRGFEADMPLDPEQFRREANTAL